MVNVIVSKDDLIAEIQHVVDCKADHSIETAECLDHIKFYFDDNKGTKELQTIQTIISMVSPSLQSHRHQLVIFVTDIVSHLTEALDKIMQLEPTLEKEILPSLFALYTLINQYAHYRDRYMLYVGICGTSEIKTPELRLFAVKELAQVLCSINTDKQNRFIATGIPAIYRSILLLLNVYDLQFVTSFTLELSKIFALMIQEKKNEFYETDSHQVIQHTIATMLILFLDEVLLRKPIINDQHMALLFSELRTLNTSRSPKEVLQRSLYKLGDGLNYEDDKEYSLVWESGKEIVREIVQIHPNYTKMIKSMSLSFVNDPEEEFELSPKSIANFAFLLILFDSKKHSYFPISWSVWTRCLLLWKVIRIWNASNMLSGNSIRLYSIVCFLYSVFYFQALSQQIKNSESISLMLKNDGILKDFLLAFLSVLYDKSNILHCASMDENGLEKSGLEQRKKQSLEKKMDEEKTTCYLGYLLLRHFAMLLPYEMGIEIFVSLTLLPLQPFVISAILNITKDIWLKALYSYQAAIAVSPHNGIQRVSDEGREENNKEVVSLAFSNNDRAANDKDIDSTTPIVNTLIRTLNTIATSCFLNRGVLRDTGDILFPALVMLEAGIKSETISNCLRHNMKSAIIKTPINQSKSFSPIGNTINETLEIIKKEVSYEYELSNFKDTQGNHPSSIENLNQLLSTQHGDLSHLSILSFRLASLDRLNA